MKIMKKLMALVLASALALTLLTGCGGGGGGGGGTGGLPDLTGKSYTMNGTTITLGSANNANTNFSQAFIAFFKQGLKMSLSYRNEDGRRAQKLIEESYKFLQANPDAAKDESVMYDLIVLQNAGIDMNNQMIFVTEETGLQDQVVDIVEQMVEWERKMGKGLNCDGKTFGYTTVSGKTKDGQDKTVMYVLVNYTLV